MKREPVLTALVVSVIVTVAANYGFDLTPAQQNGLSLLVAAIAGVWARSKVSPV